MHPRKLLRIARWEVTKNAGGIDRRTAVITVVSLVLFGAMIPVVVSQGIALDDGIYRVGIDESSPYYEVVETDPTFAVRSPAAPESRIDMRIDGATIGWVAPTSKGQAALSELRSSVEQYNDATLLAEEDRSVAFPVRVTLLYLERSTQLSLTTGAGDGDDGSLSGSDGGADGSGAAGGPESGGGTGGSGGTEGGTSSVTGGTGDAGDVGPAGGVGGIVGRLTGESSIAGTPSDIAPPFPFRSLVFAFVFVLPLNFVIQAYGSSILSERLNRRGELMLVSPVTRSDIIVGKTLPYFGAAIGLEAALAVGLSWVRPGPVGGLTSTLAIAPLVALFLGATFLAAMFARSFKELTFVTVTITVSLTSYAFVPAIFTDVTPIALISPLTIVVRDLQNQAITAGEFAFSTLPPTLVAGVFFGLGAGLYREEDMFTQRPIPLKVLDAFAGRIRARWSALVLSAILIPFVFVAELVGVAALFAIPGAFSIPAMLLIVAVVEELAKSVHLYAGFVHGRYERTLTDALFVGALSGLGFFLAEKFVLIVQLLGVQNLPQVERAAFVTGIAPESLPVAIGFLFAPLVLHAVTASASAVGAIRGRAGYAAGITAAIVIHLAYNLTVVMVIGG